MKTYINNYINFYIYIYIKELINYITMGIIKTISLTREQDRMAQEHNLSWTEAARIGMGILLADKGIAEYSGDLNIARKMNIFRLKAEEATQDLNALKAKYHVVGVSEKNDFEN